MSSEVEDNKDISSNTSVAPATVTQRTHLGVVGKKPIKAVSPKVRARKAPIIKTKVSKLKTI